MRFCSSLPTMLKFSNETWWPVVLKWSKIGEGALRCSLNLSKCSGWFTYVFIITLHPVAFKSVDDSTSALHRILILWSHQEVFDCCTSLEVHLHPMVIASFLEIVGSIHQCARMVFFWIRKVSTCCPSCSLVIGAGVPLKQDTVFSIHHYNGLTLGLRSEPCPEHWWENILLVNVKHWLV